MQIIEQFRHHWTALVQIDLRVLVWKTRFGGWVRCWEIIMPFTTMETKYGGTILGGKG